MSKTRRLSPKELKKLTKDAICPLCNELRPQLWACHCGCVICDFCMKRDIWGYTCNHITWECPDCGSIRSF